MGGVMGEEDETYRSSLDQAKITNFFADPGENPSHFGRNFSFQKMTCEVLITEGFDSTSPRAMEEAENPNSGSSSAKDVDMDETSKKPSKAADICERLHQMIFGDPSNFNSWTALIDLVERSCPDNIDAICFAYDSLLLKFPLCHWYWRKYAYEMIRLSDPNKAVEIFERALNLGMYSLGLWLDYCCFGMSFFKDKGAVRR
ncbi:hypothetical protein M9H77_11131 [Catharanthus roseus]|uniref:Uncharacterized protein n=1 Tax=Catharanthus roseus TaxID=4058 RepID=A0ACC0BDV4_CATRO|nr:hypothetical protein M9H77_11131 [Catharanthus roseus]